MISAIGKSYEETLLSFKNGQSGIGHITQLNTIYKNALPVGEVKLTNEQLATKLNCEPTTRTALLALHAAKEALKNSGISNLKMWRTGLISATTVGGMDRTENFYANFAKEPTAGNLNEVRDHECGRSAERVADILGIRDFISTINTACSSSVNSIMLGARLIQQRMLDVVVAGGADALTKFTINGFNSLMILDKEPCRPFDASRNGLNLGEGAGFLVLVSEAVLKQEKLRPACYVSGFANTNDAYHQTASSPEGRGSFAAMAGALQMARLTPEEIDYINLHGTGTVNNDQSEGTAIASLFSGKMPKLSSTKSFTGHTLGACGGLEAAFSVMAIEHDAVFPNLRFQNPIPELNIIPQTTYQEGLSIRHVMSNSFGFGGNCSSILFSKN